MAYNKVFSDYEIKETSIKVNSDGEKGERIGCVGTLEETMDVRTVIKKCEGILAKSRTKGTGSGELKITLHIRWDLYVRIYGMKFPDKLAEGVYAYGKDSKHEEFTIASKVLDEDDVVKYLAYPRCVINAGTAKKIENGSEEVAEIEMSVAVFPDEQGFGKYEAMESELTDENIKTKWLTDFNYDLVKVVKAEQTTQS